MLINCPICNNIIIVKTNQSGSYYVHCPACHNELEVTLSVKIKKEVKDETRS